MKTNARAAGWFLLFATAAFLCVAGDSVARVARVRAATAVETWEAAPDPAPVSPGARERMSELPADSVDAKWWIMHTEEMLRRGGWRIRDTRVDNAPQGREVHWSSALPLVLATIAHLRSLATGTPVLDEVQNAALWVGPILFVALVALLALLVAPRFGWGIAGFQILILATCRPSFEAFRAGDADHHGFIVIFCAASVVCLASGGAGVHARPSAQRWFMLSGLLAAASLWVSAASTIPVLVGTACGALAAVFVSRKHKTQFSPQPELWRAWARAGAAGSLFFYLLEYFPSHLGWRLEVNHPLYALAWLGGGELLVGACRWLAGGRFLTGGRFRDRAWLGGSIAAVVAPVLAIALWPGATFWVSDPLLLTLLTESVRELRPLISMLDGPSPFALGVLLWPACAIAAASWLALRARIPPPWLPVLTLAFVPAMIIQAEALLQVRWSSLALGLWSVCVVILLRIWSEQPKSAPLPRGIVFIFGIVGSIALLAWPLQIVPEFLSRGAAARMIPQNAVPGILLRDTAHRLLRSSPQRLPVVFSDPTSSTELAYFGGLHTLGTLYWENQEGLRRAAEIFAAPDETQTRTLLERATVSHIVLPTWDTYSTPVAYAALLVKAGLRASSAGSPYLEEVLRGRSQPAWLRPVAYSIPEAFGMPQERIRIFEVRPGQTPAQATFHWGIYAAQTGALSSALETLTEARRLDPENPEIPRWLAEVAAALRRQR